MHCINFIKINYIKYIACTNVIEYAFFGPYAIHFGPNVLIENETNKYRKSLLNLLIKMVNKEEVSRIFLLIGNSHGVHCKQTVGYF